jgi:pSer/pThr/pTyr-binding forkhead associated (FHA) protein
MSQPPKPGQPNPSFDGSGTLLESEEDVREALLSGLKAQPAAPASAPVGAPRPVPPPMPPPAVAPPPPAVTPPPRPVATGAGSPYRPTIRPPVPLLIVFDDGRMEGEVIRLREPKFVIGRTEGDLRLPMDSRISARHVEITYQYVDGLHRWVVTDLQSTHGMFVRVSKTVLADKAEILVGNGRYRFDIPQPEAATIADFAPEEPKLAATVGWDGPSPFRSPVLTELLGSELGDRTPLVKNEYWIGSHPSCAICRPDDPFCEPYHIRLHQKPQRGWHAEHNKTVNGLWLRMSQIAVEPMVHFQIGEQRFQIKVP